MTLELRDVSEWNAWTDPAATAASGVVAVIAKATEGNGFVDPTWAANRAAMLAHFDHPGAYHFSRPDLGNAPDAEAEWFLNVANPSNGWLLFHDAESAGGSLAWCDEFERHCAALLGDYHVWFYSFLAWMTARGIPGSPLLERSPLWFAWPDANGPLPGLGVAMQQYGAGPSAGFASAVDQNRFFGGRDQLSRLTIGGGTPQEDDMANVILVAGDGQGAPDPHGTGAVYLVRDWPYGPKRWIEDPAELVAYETIAGAVQTVPQGVLDRCEEEPPIAIGSYVVVDVAATKAELDAAKAELDQLVAGSAGAVDLTPVTKRLDALSVHLGVGTA